MGTSRNPSLEACFVEKFNMAAHQRCWALCLNSISLSLDAKIKDLIMKMFYRYKVIKRNT
jgi:hypothetical protein